MTKRFINCDVLRIIAFLLVICVHSLLYSGFYETVTVGYKMLFLNIIRTLFVICVPLFMVISGYLMLNKKFDKKYVLKLSKIILTYVICSIICIGALYFIQNKEVFSIKESILSILGFSGAPYSWYVNMYIGLYLLIPFLNILWKGLDTKKNRQYLLIVLIILFILPTLLNIYNFYDINWWKNPASSTIYNPLVPNFWMGNGYPVLFYYIGCYLKEYKLNMGVFKNIFLIVIFMIIFGLFNYYRSYGSFFDGGIHSGYYSFESLVITVLFANLILNNFTFNIKNKLGLGFIKKISMLTFGAYLLSAIFDLWFYPMLNSKVIEFRERVFYLGPMIIIIAVCSLGLAYGEYLLEVVIKKIFKKRGCLK